MNKELEALKYLKENKRRHWLEGDKSNECLGIIETALKEGESAKKIVDELVDLETIQKKLKALENIKEKRVDTLLLFRCFDLDNLYGYSHLETYNQVLYTQNITQEEYDLLREVLL